MFILCCITHSDWLVNSMSIWPAYLAEVTDNWVRQIKISSVMASGVLLGRVWYRSPRVNLFFFLEIPLHLVCWGPEVETISANTYC